MSEKSISSTELKSVDELLADLIDAVFRFKQEVVIPMIRQNELQGQTHQK